MANEHLLRHKAHYHQYDIMVIISCCSQQFLNDKHLLSSSELKLLLNKRTQKAQEQFVASRILIKKCLASLYQIDAKTINVSFNESSKTLEALTYDKVLSELSLSHSGSYIALAIPLKSFEFLGIDIERTGIKRDVKSLAKVSLTIEEYDDVIASTNQDLEFIKQWTLKEAISKATHIDLPLLFSLNSQNVMTKHELMLQQVLGQGFVCSLVHPHHSITKIVRI